MNINPKIEVIHLTRFYTTWEKKKHKNLWIVKNNKPNKLAIIYNEMFIDKIEACINKLAYITLENDSNTNINRKTQILVK